MTNAAGEMKFTHNFLTCMKHRRKKENSNYSNIKSKTEIAILSCIVGAFKLTFHRNKLRDVMRGSESKRGV